MQTEKRMQEKYDYDELVDLLSETQAQVLRQIEYFGWEIHFVRKPLFQDILPVVMSGDGKSIGVLEVDGRINMQSDVVLRD